MGHMVEKSFLVGTIVRFDVVHNELFISSWGLFIVHYNSTFSIEEDLYKRITYRDPTINS